MVLRWDTYSVVLLCEPSQSFGYPCTSNQSVPFPSKATPHLAPPTLDYFIHALRLPNTGLTLNRKMMVVVDWLVVYEIRSSRRCQPRRWYQKECNYWGIRWQVILQEISTGRLVSMRCEQLDCCKFRSNVTLNSQPVLFPPHYFY